MGLITLGLLALSCPSQGESRTKFPPISGVIFGQTVAGVKSITVNNRPVEIDANQSFNAKVDMKAGEKYLTLTINYGSFKIVKKYLILRKPQVKTFKVFVPKEKIQKPPTLPTEEQSVKAKYRRLRYLQLQARLRNSLIKKAQAKKAAQQLKLRAIKAKRGTYHFVWEFSPGKLLLVKTVKGIYSADIFIPATGEWFNLQGLTRKELKELIDDQLPAQDNKEKTKPDKKKGKSGQT